MKLTKNFLALIAIFLLVTLVSASCSSTSDKRSSKTLTLVTYDSFPTKDTSLNSALEEFEKETGIKVKVANAGDTGAMLSKAILTSGNPEGDVIWGIDNSSISTALKNNIFETYKPKNKNNLDSNLTNILKNDLATPVDYGDVCINYDIEYFERRNLEVPTQLSDLTKPAYKGLLVVENPASSSPGLAFLMATIVEFGEDEYIKFWKDLKTNEVKVTESWNSAYYELFSGSSGKGEYPLVVSYATSPVAEVMFSDPPLEKSPTGNIDSTCFRQVEFAGILRGTKKMESAKKLMDFLISKKFQKEIALNLFVYPALKDVAIDDVFKKNSNTIDNPYTIDPALIDENRETWIETWTHTVLR